VIVFVDTCMGAQLVALLLRNLGFSAICLHGKMTQQKRFGSLNKFKAGQESILIATDVASRGLDIPAVDIVINYDIPNNGKEYIHRVGRTARAGRSGRSIAFVTQYDVEIFQRLEALIGQKLTTYSADEETVLILLERVSEAQVIAARELTEMDLNGKQSKRKREEDDNDNEKIQIEHKQTKILVKAAQKKHGGNNMEKKVNKNNKKRKRV